MSRPQILRCAERLPENKRAEFLQMLEQASALLSEGWRLRKLAWTTYYELTGRRKRGEVTK